MMTFTFTFTVYLCIVFCCSFTKVIGNFGNQEISDHLFTVPAPKDLSEARAEIEQIIDETFPDDVENENRMKIYKIISKFSDKVSNMITNLRVLNQRVISSLMYQLESALTSNKQLRLKMALRNEVDHQMERLAPSWLLYLNLRTKHEWLLLFQLESEPIEILKQIISEEVQITLDMFANDMDQFVEKTARNVHFEDMPHFDSEDEMDAMLESLGFQKKSLRKSIIALTFFFRNKENIVLTGIDNKFCFLYFPSLKTKASEQNIVDFLNEFDIPEVHVKNVTIFKSEISTNDERSFDTDKVFVRFNITSIRDGKEVNMCITY